MLKLIFVGGAPRSGNTLVHNVLDSHAQVAGGPEFDRIPDIVGLRNKLQASVRNGRIATFVTEAQVDASVAGFVDTLLGPYATRRGVNCIAEKTPWNVLVAGDLLEALPDARFIFCLRDPRAVASSMLDVGRRAARQNRLIPYLTQNLSAAIFTIRACLEAGFAAAERYPDRVFVNVFERLVTQPERETRRLLRFCELPWDPQVLHPEAVRHDHEATIDSVWYDRKRFYRAYDATACDRWRRALSPREQAAVVAAFADSPILRRFGYDLSQPMLPVGTLARARLAFRLEKTGERMMTSLRGRARRFNPARELFRRGTYLAKNAPD